VINEAGFNNAFYYFKYDRNVRDWAIVRQLILSSGEMTNSLRMG